MRLVDALESLSAGALERLVVRRGGEIDPGKRLTALEQASRILSVLPPSALRSLSAASREVLARLTASPGLAPRSTLGGGVVSLFEQGLVFSAGNDLVALPNAYRLQLPAPIGEDPCAARARLAVLDDATYRAIAQAHLGRAPVAPRPRVLDEILERLEQEREVASMVRARPLDEQRLLMMIEARGGEVTTEELLELAREPARYVSSLPKHGAPWSLVTHALLLPRGKGGSVASAGSFAIPAEVARFVGQKRRAAAARAREQITANIARAEDEPARAVLADDPGLSAVALLAELHARGETSISIKSPSPRPIRRPAIEAVAKLAGVDAARAGLLIALGRSIRWEGVELGQAGARLVERWRSSLVWDEARIEPERARAVRGDASTDGPAPPAPTPAIREALLELLSMLPAGKFALSASVLEAARTDLRWTSAARLLELARRTSAGALVSDLDAIAMSVLERSMPALGLLDLARDESGSWIRLSARGRALLSGEASHVSQASSEWASLGARQSADVEIPVLRVGVHTSVTEVLTAARAARALVDRGSLVLVLDSERVQALADEGELSGVTTSLRSIAHLPAETVAMLTVTPRSRVRCELFASSAYLAVPDPDMLAFLSNEPAISRWIARVVTEGIVFLPGAPLRAIERRLRRLGGTIDRHSSRP